MEQDRKHAIIIGGVFLAVGLVMATVVFPFWNLIREDIYEEVIILANDDGTCYAESYDLTAKTISDCTAHKGDVVNIKYGRDLAWAVIVE
ncbi:MAG: putative membrane protein [Cenarchaeum symbiont of Oopsacas minuta]|nr:putative membrane protein [Cenarchaeum symbiont of Oopsacas minuta]